ncbi:helix-turn-helix domain-containing protein [Streptomyces polygonati]|uniref:Helix-turn-helix domain-containing protein n=1 Tax=Streptomyces polygonati TaxID=1617087 RepID=A0ABV8HUT6_9ACTN
MPESNEYDLPKLKPRSRLTPEQRETAGAKIQPVYEGGGSIRDIAELTGRSYGFVHRLLSDRGVPLRGRGGASRKRKNNDDQ